MILSILFISLPIPSALRLFCRAASLVTIGHTPMLGALTCYIRITHRELQSVGHTTTR